MLGECHAHLFMNGTNYRQAVLQHQREVDRQDVRAKLETYRAKGISFIRDGGDAFGVSEYASGIAQEYGIDYRTPVFAIHKNEHYGRIVGRGFDSFREYHSLVQEAAARGADFIKVMFSGILDFARAGAMTEEPLAREEIFEMVHIAHEEGFAVMAHVNGAEAVQAAAEAGADSIEHGNFVNGDGLQAMAEHHTVWIPTFVTIANLIGSGRFCDADLLALKKEQGARIRRGFEQGVWIGNGSDAGAYRVLHAQGTQEEALELYALWQQSRREPESQEQQKQQFLSRMQAAEQEIHRRFRRH